jgi:ADP-ribose pyrophosphatase YjhB (NUDIX family)
VAIEPVLDQVHRVALRVYRSLPALARRWVVRLIAPSYTVGAIAVVERPDGHILLVRQGYRQRWGIPGGLLKRGEDPAVGARREVFEEVGIAIELLGPPAVVVAARPQRVDVIFRARPVALSEVGEARPSSPEIVEVGWFAPDALPELQAETVEALVTLARLRARPLDVDLGAD